MGVMNLAENLPITYGICTEAHGIDSIPSKNHVETGRLAGLLHDVGHGPMGHTLDEIYAKWLCMHP